MRLLLVFPVLLMLAGCIPGSDRPPPRAPLPGASRPASQCEAELRAENVGFRSLEDRLFPGGCSAVGAVQLLEIGTPVANLGAMTCPLARQFARWTRLVLQPAARTWLGTPVRRIETFGTFACRPVNSRSGARISEHGFANAVDVAAFELADGRRVTVAAGWGGEEERVRRFLRAIHEGGCRHFQVVLGPDADLYHRDHLHFDLGRGPYCR